MATKQKSRRKPKWAWKRPPKIKPFVPKRLDYETGERVPLIPIRRPWTRRTSVIVRGIERGWFVKEAESRWHACASLRRMPEDLWNALIDVLPRCDCGRPVAPSRARFSRCGISYCSDTCRQKHWNRIIKRGFMLKRIERQREAYAMAEALAQG